MKWFKVWTGLRDDPDIQKLTDKEFRQWIYILDYCAERETDGLWIMAGKLPAVYRGLVEKGRLVPTDTRFVYYVKGWGTRQKSVADLLAVAMERSKAGSKGQAKRSANRTANPSANDEQPPQQTLDSRLKTPEEPTTKALPSAGNPHQPSHDQIYLDRGFETSWGKSLGVPALVKLNKAWGRVEVTDVMRSLHGFPPPELETAFGYITTVCKLRAEAV